MVRVCGDLEGAYNDEWIIRALQQPYLGVWGKALRAFVRKSLKRPDPYEWLDRERHRIPAALANKIQQEIEKARTPPA